MVLHKLDGFLWPFSVLYLNWLPLHVLCSLPWMGETVEIQTLRANTVAYCLLSTSHKYSSRRLSYLLLMMLLVFLCLGALYNVSGKRSVLYPWYYWSRNQSYLWCDTWKEEMSGHAWRTKSPSMAWDTTGKQDRWEQPGKTILLSQIIQARKSLQA